MAIYFTQEQKKEVAQAIKNAEANTSGEIYCVVAHRSDNYNAYIMAGAVFLALIVPLILAIIGIDLGAIVAQFVAKNFGGWQAAHIFDNANNHLSTYLVLGLQLLIFLLISLLAKSKFYLSIIPKAVKQRAVHAKALEQFYAHGIQNTMDKTGVLVFVSLEEHIVEIIADKGINDKVQIGFWDKAVEKILTQTKQGNLALGLKEGIGEIGTELAANFPQRPDDINELSDAVIFI